MMRELKLGLTQCFNLPQLLRLPPEARKPSATRHCACRARSPRCSTRTYPLLRQHRPWLALRQGSTDGLGTRAAHILFTEPTLRGSLAEPPICRLRVGGDQADVPLRRSGTKVVVDVPTGDVCALSVA